MTTTGSANVFGSSPSGIPFVEDAIVSDVRRVVGRGFPQKWLNVT
jgi:hypothetical protein